MDETPIVTIREAARYCGLPKKTFEYHLYKTRRAPQPDTRGAAGTVWSRGALDAFVEAYQRSKEHLTPLQKKQIRLMHRDGLSDKKICVALWGYVNGQRARWVQAVYRQTPENP